MNMKTTHTPGPWKIDGGTNKDGDLHIWHAGNYFGGHGLAQVFADGARVHGGTVEANARLIAAAPELLELVRRASDFLEMNGSARVALVEDCRAAIARAKGE